VWRDQACAWRGEITRSSGSGCSRIGARPLPVILAAFAAHDHRLAAATRALMSQPNNEE